MRIVYRYVFVFFILVLVTWLILTTSEDEEKSSPSSFWTTNGETTRFSRSYGDLPCTLNSCFNFSRCIDKRLKVYVYPSLDGDVVSSAYAKILQAIRESAYFTPNPHEACLFVLSVDTIDRDKISDNYVRDVNELIDNLPMEIWNGGHNHVIFNLYHGTFPDYADHNLGFNTGKAIVARASPNVQHFRFGFDISFPLFHKEHSLRAATDRMYHLHSVDPLLVSFKGKRYVYGIGSETRDALHYIHNGAVAPMITTCKHNNDWKEHQDDRCERDNIEYEKWDYESMMVNSTFCLTPRGRRLGSFRFLESLRAGCIPVVLSDDWVLPFDEVIDWSTAAVVIAEENVLLVPGILSQITPQRVIHMKENGRHLYNFYFRDVESITLSSLRTIFDRIQRSENLNSKGNVENFAKLEFTNCTSLNILIQAGSKPTKSLQSVLDVLSLLSDPINQVFVIWPNERGVAPLGADFGTHLPISLINKTEAFGHGGKTQKQCGICVYIDETVPFDTSDLRRLISYAKREKHRMIGLHGIDFNPLSGHVKFSDVYNAAFPSILAFDGRYMEALVHRFPSSILIECPLVALNLLVSDLSALPPIILGGRSQKPPQITLNSQFLSCWKEVTARWDFNPPLHYSSLHVV